MTDDPGELILYRTDDGRSEIQLRAVDGTVWLTQAEVAELFDTTSQNVGQHVRGIYEEGELDEAATRKNLFQVRQEGARTVRREVQGYNLDMVLAVGYRVRSPRGAQFRQWATTTLREYLIKGFVLNDERLKEPGGFDYFDELLERIRDIRASEKRFYQKVRDVFAVASADYDKRSTTAQTFFASIQNKLLYAVTGRTAAELIVERSDPGRPNMGLTSWQGGRVAKRDVTTSKNYLTSDELSTLNQLTTQFLDFAELRARRRQQTTMAQWVELTDQFVQLNAFDTLSNAGMVSNEEMRKTAHARFAEFDSNRRRIEAARADEDDRHEALLELERVETELTRRRNQDDRG